MLAAFGRAVGLGKPKPTLVSKTAKRNNGGNWESPPVAAMPPLGRSPAASFSSNGSRRGSNASTVSAANAGSRRGSNATSVNAGSRRGSNASTASAVSTQPAFVIPRGARAKLAAGTLVSNAQTKRANAATKAYNNQKAANEAYFRTLDERYARKPSGMDPASLLIGGPSTRSGEGPGAGGAGSGNAATSWAVPSQVAAYAEAFPQPPLVLPEALPYTAPGSGARIFGSAKPLPAAPVASAAAPAPAAQGPLLDASRRNLNASRRNLDASRRNLDASRRNSRKHNRKSKRSRRNRKTRRSH